MLLTRLKRQKSLRFLPEISERRDSPSVPILLQKSLMRDVSCPLTSSLILAAARSVGSDGC
jgi:hypothetical protein